MSKKVCMLSRQHSVIDCRIYYKEARTLRDAGYDVHIITRLLNGAFPDMGGNIFSYPDEDGIMRYDGMTFHGFQKRRGVWGKYQEYKDLVRIGLSLNADFYHCHESDIVLASGAKIKKTLSKKTKFIFDSHEFSAADWAYYVMGSYYRTIWPLFSKIEKIFLKNDDYFIASDLPTAGALQLYDLNRKVTVIYNSPVLGLNNSSNGNKIPLPLLNRGKIVLCHEGPLDNWRKLDTIVDIMEHLKNTCVLYVIGGIRKLDGNLKSRVEKLKEEDHIIDIGWIPYESICSALQPAQIGLIFLKNHPNLITAAPNKLFNYMAAGIPMIVDDYPGMRDIVQQYKCGILVNPSKLENYITAIQYIIDHPVEAKAMGRRGKEAIINELSWEYQGEKLLKIYEEVHTNKPYIL
jgi:glycosyltransferase involved in cell wall biosynthesis